MTKLSTTLVAERLLNESEEVKATYDTMAKPNGKAKKVGNPSNRSTKTTRVTQVEVPKSYRSKTSKGKTVSAKMGIPAAEYAGDIADRHEKAPDWSSAKNEKSPKTPTMKRNKPNQTTKFKEIKGAVKNTDGGKDSKKVGGIPSAEQPTTFIGKAQSGNTGKGRGKGRDKALKAPTAAKLSGTTAPTRSAAKLPKSMDSSKTVSQVKHTGGKQKSTSEAPATPKWEKVGKGHNVLESVQITLDGRRKSSFDVIHKDVARKLVENYRSFGYDVSVVKSDKPAAWKSDKQFLKAVYEAIDANYNNAPVSSSRARKAAMNRFFELSTGDYNAMYESRQHFTKTIKSAFDFIMERVDTKYRQNLNIYEGICRVETKDGVMDVEMITQARNTDMALRNFRNEVMEDMGFNTDIRHIFVEGEKFLPGDIKEWSGSTK